MLCLFVRLFQCFRVKLLFPVRICNEFRMIIRFQARWDAFNIYIKHLTHRYTCIIHTHTTTAFRRTVMQYSSLDVLQSIITIILPIRARGRGSSCYSDCECGFTIYVRLNKRCTTNSIHFTYSYKHIEVKKLSIILQKIDRHIRFISRRDCIEATARVNLMQSIH